MKAGTNITTKKVIGALKKKSKSRAHQNRAVSKDLVKTAKRLQPFKQMSETEEF